MTDERSRSVEAEVPVDEDVIDLGEHAAGASASRGDAEAVRGEDPGSAGGARDAGVEPPD